MPLIIVVTGASGAGKTSLVRGLEARALPGVGCSYFDSVGVPSPTRMVAEFGSGDAWQRATLRTWIDRLVINAAGVAVAILDGQVRPSDVRAAFAERGVTGGRIVLVDCDDATRDARLRGPRGQPELATSAMTNWAAALRAEGGDLQVPVIDTTRGSVGDATNALSRLVREWSSAA